MKMINLDKQYPCLIASLVTNKSLWAVCVCFTPYRIFKSFSGALKQLQISSCTVSHRYIECSCQGWLEGKRISMIQFDLTSAANQQMNKGLMVLLSSWKPNIDWHLVQRGSVIHFSWPFVSCNGMLDVNVPKGKVLPVTLIKWTFCLCSRNMSVFSLIQ